MPILDNIKNTKTYPELGKLFGSNPGPGKTMKSSDPNNIPVTNNDRRGEKIHNTLSDVATGVATWGTSFRPPNAEEIKQGRGGWSDRSQLLAKSATQGMENELIGGAISKIAGKLVNPSGILKSVIKPEVPVESPIMIGDKIPITKAERNILDIQSSEAFTMQIKRGSENIGKATIEHVPEGGRIKWIDNTFAQIKDPKTRGTGREAMKLINTDLQKSGKVLISDIKGKNSSSMIKAWDKLVTSGEVEKLGDESYRFKSGSGIYGKAKNISDRGDFLINRQDLMKNMSRDAGMGKEGEEILNEVLPTIGKQNFETTAKQAGYNKVGGYYTPSKLYDPVDYNPVSSSNAVRTK